MYQQAVGLEILLRGYRGKQFPDATSESPGADLEDELTPVKKWFNLGHPELRVIAGW